MTALYAGSKICLGLSLIVLLLLVLLKRTNMFSNPDLVACHLFWYLAWVAAGSSWVHG